MTADDYEIVERLVAECANALGTERPPAVFVPGASCVEIDMSGKYGRASDVIRLRRTLAALLAARGLPWVVTRTSLRRLSVSDGKIREVDGNEDS